MAVLGFFFVKHHVDMMSLRVSIMTRYSTMLISCSHPVNIVLSLYYWFYDVHVVCRPCTGGWLCSRHGWDPWLGFLWGRWGICRGFWPRQCSRHSIQFWQCVLLSGFTIRLCNLFSTCAVGCPPTSCTTSFWVLEITGLEITSSIHMSRAFAEAVRSVPATPWILRSSLPLRTSPSKSWCAIGR